jgi:biotin carboxylase
VAANARRAKKGKVDARAAAAAAGVNTIEGRDAWITRAVEGRAFSVRAIGAAFGLSHVAVMKIARRQG